MQLENKVGIVTAGASGMGRAGAIRFAREGAAVAVVDINSDNARNTVDEIARAGGRAVALCGDLCDEAFARRIVHDTVKRFGGLGFLWNHAGHPGPSLFEGLDLKDFDAAINLNIRSAVATTSEAIPFLRKRGGGSVLFTASGAGLQGSPFSPVYSVVKFGVVGLAKSLAKRYGRERIRFNVLCPGTTDTPMLRVFVARPDDASTQGQDPESLIVKRGGNNPLGRIARPEEVANCALFLLSDEASYVNGVAMPIDGGSTA